MANYSAEVRRIIEKGYGKFVIEITPVEISAESKLDAALKLWKFVYRLNDMGPTSNSQKKFIEILIDAEQLSDNFFELSEEDQLAEVKEGLIFGNMEGESEYEILSFKKGDAYILKNTDFDIKKKDVVRI